MNLTWDSLNVHSEIKQVIKNEFRFERMTAVQAASIPLFITNKDLTVEAVTGSGKTFAFVVPILEILLKKSSIETIKKHDIGAIVISPTRELATQTYDVFKRFTDNLHSFAFKSMLLIGGSNPYKDIQAYMNGGAHIIVSTPGRLFDLLEKSDNFSERVRKCLEVFVLDEADQLLSMGFERTLNDILAFLPKLRRTSLFSATQTKELEQLIRAGLRNPVKIEIKEKNANKSNKAESGQVQMPNRLMNRYLRVESCEHKLPFLIKYLRAQNAGKYLIFMSTCAQVNFFEKILSHFINGGRDAKKSITLLKLHRKLKNKRAKIFDQFREIDHCVLLCTDVMSRGVDVPHVDCVIHFDLPLTIDSYIHRCGRSGHQANVAGNSLLLCLAHEHRFVQLCADRGATIEPMTITNFGEEQQDDDDELRETILRWIKAESRRDINMYDAAVQAFVSFIRTYSTKHCMSRTLFRECDAIDIANAYGLLRLPAMPELRQAKRESNREFKRAKDDEKIVQNFKDILYAKKCKNRDPNLDDDDDDDADGDGAKAATRTGKFGYKRNPEMQEKYEKLSKKLKGKKRRDFMNNLELEELEQDARMVKKLKKGKITSKQFDQHFGL